MKDENYKPFSNEQFKLTNKALTSKMPFGFYYDVQSRHIEPNGLEINSGDYTFSTNLGTNEYKSERNRAPANTGLASFGPYAPQDKLY